jgi:hypothetical protein
MRKTLLVVFGCAVALTGILFLVRVGIILALMSSYRPPLERAYNDELALQDVANLGTLRECYRWVTYLLVTGLIAVGLLGGAVLVMLRSSKAPRSHPG